MEDTVLITPTVIRWVGPDKLGLVGMERDGKWALLVWRSPEQAEAFRSETGSYPEAEGFAVVDVDLEDLRAFIDVWEYKHVALRGPEADTVSFLRSDDFLRWLQESVEA